MKRFIGTQVITLSKENYNKHMKYYLTYKLDGQRHLYQNGHLITSKLEKIKFPINGVQFGTLLDGELYKGIYYVFDILFYNGNDIRKLNFNERYKIMKGIKGITCKEYLCNDTKSDFFYLKNKYKNDMHIGGMVDGIIFTPDAPYNVSPLKWKPVNLLSIDFKIHKRPEKTFDLLLQNGKVYTSTIVSKNQFNWYNDNTVVEFVYKGDKFIPIRARPDKENSNHLSVIKSNLEQIKTPVNMRSLLSS